MILREAADRFWEIDLIRGMAIVIMICFHFLYDLNYFSITQFSLYTGSFFFLAYGTASIFILLVGISLTLKYHRLEQKIPNNQIFPLFLHRGIKIIILGFIITIITFWYIPDRVIIFGILHFVGVSIILSYPFIIYKDINILLGLVIIILGIYIQIFTVDVYWFLPLGLVPNRFSTIDFFPLFPWFGIVLIGIWIGNFAYKDGKRRYQIKDLSDNFIISILCFLGRNSLFIYFLHQPILFSLIYFFFL